MTKKDYVKFAAMFADIYRSDCAPVVENLIEATADIFAADDPRFDREKFYKACNSKND